MEIETQEGNVIVEKFTVSWDVLKTVLFTDSYVNEYLQRSGNPVNWYMKVPTRVFEFALEATP
jgi:hypothetical protein